MFLYICTYRKSEMPIRRERFDWKYCRFFLLCAVCMMHSVHVEAQSQPAEEVVRDSTDFAYMKEYLGAMTDSLQIVLDTDQLPPAVMEPIHNLNVRNADVRDLLRGLGREYDLNILVDNSTDKNVTVRLSGIPVLEAIIHICRDNGLSLMQTGRVFRVDSYTPEQPEPEVRIPVISISEDGKMTLDLQDDELDQVVRTLSGLSGNNIVIRNGVSGRLSGFLQNIPFKLGLETMLSNNGFALREREGIYIVDRAGMRSGEGETGDRQNFWVNVDDNGHISMDVVNAQITDLVREIAWQTEVNLVTYNLPDGMLTAKTNNLTLEQTFDYLFRGTDVTYRRERDIYVIGDKQTSGIATNKLIRLNHIRADVVMEMLPESVTRGATVQLIKEQNGLMVIGTNDIILELENFIYEIDHPTPQILIEALVVDAKTSDLFELGATLGYQRQPDEGFDLGSFGTFGIGENGRPSGDLMIQGDGRDVNRLFEVDGNLFGIKNLGVLPSDFYFRVQALNQEGIINIRSRPQISTLNGHTASIEIGTTQYFILKTTTPISSPRDVVVQEGERFETIEAMVSLEITPWVSASGEVTTEILPSFNTPVGEFNALVPPTINSRVLDSTVRLKDGETIILGGLIQESENLVFNKVPILGSIPLLGRLFSNRRTETVKSELVIFITPHVFYGNEEDAVRWKDLSEQLNFDPEQ